MSPPAQVTRPTSGRQAPPKPSDLLISFPYPSPVATAAAFTPPSPPLPLASRSPAEGVLQDDGLVPPRSHAHQDHRARGVALDAGDVLAGCRRQIGEAARAADVLAPAAHGFEDGLRALDVVDG